MKELENLKRTILEEYPRLAEDSSFTFHCHKGVSCFNDCCGDVNIFLTPYDIIRLKSKLGISSGEFLSKYTISPFDEKLQYPVVMLKMEENDKRSCPFVGEDGCRVYNDRPWSCRMYPLGQASPKEGSEALDEEFYFLLQESVCKGFAEDKKWTVAEWIKDQGIDDYHELGELFKEIALHDSLREGKGMSPEKVEMFFTVAYNIDKFHDFVFKSTFFDKFEVDEDTQNKIRNDDVELLKFGFEWLRFSLFGESTMTIRSDVYEAKKKELEEKTSPKKGH
jgi:Fe-S-cluster containining protein